MPNTSAITHYRISEFCPVRPCPGVIVHMFPGHTVSVHGVDLIYIYKIYRDVLQEVLETRILESVQ